MAVGPAVCYGMVGCLGSVQLVRGTPGLPPLDSWPVLHWGAVSVLILRIVPASGSRDDFWCADDLALEMTYSPNSWTDGSWEDYHVGGFEVAGAAVYLPAPEEAMRGSVWCVAEEYGDAGLERCRVFMPVPGPLESVQRVEFWGATIALQSCWPCHLGVDNLNVARSIGRLLDHGCLAKSLPLVKYGDLVAIAQYMILDRRQDTVRVAEVKEHATENVQQGRVREADAAADLGGRHQSELVMDARRVLLSARNHWYPIVLQLHRFMVAVSRVAVNHYGRSGSAPDPLVWDQGSKRKQRKTDTRINVDLASLPGPLGFSKWALGSSSWRLYHWC